VRSERAKQLFHSEGLHGGEPARGVIAASVAAATAEASAPTPLRRASTGAMPTEYSGGLRAASHSCPRVRTGSAGAADAGSSAPAPSRPLEDAPAALLLLQRRAAARVVPGRAAAQHTVPAVAGARRCREAAARPDGKGKQRPDLPSAHMATEPPAGAIIR